MILSAKIAAVELDGDRVRVAVVKTGGKVPTVLEFHHRPVSYAEPEERRAATVQALQEILEAMKNRPAAFVLVASSRYAAIRALTVPLKGARRVAAAVRFELEPYLAFPIEELIVDYATLGEDSEGTRVLAVGLRRAALEEQLSILTECGIDPEGIGLDAAGLTALWQIGRKVRIEIHAALHICEGGSILAVTRGRSLVYFRHLPVTVALAHENPAAVARDVHNSLRAYRSTDEAGEEPVDLTVTGVDLFEEERRLFEEGIAIPVVYEDLREKVKFARAGEGAVGENPEGNVAETLVGVALAAAARIPYGFNFRKDELARPNEFRGLMQHALFSGAIALLVLVGYGFHLYLEYRDNRAETARLSGEIWQMFVETFPNSQRAADGRPSGDLDGSMALSFMREEYEKALTGGREVPLDMFRGSNFLDILAEIGRHMPESKVTVTQVRLDPPGREADPRSGRRVVIEGVAGNPEVINQVIGDLGRGGVLEIVGDPQMQTSPDGQWRFTAIAFLRGASNVQA